MVRDIFHPIDAGFADLQGQRAFGRQFVGQFQGGGLQLIRWHDFVDQSQPLRLGRRENISRQYHLQSLFAADVADQRGRGSEADEADIDGRGPEFGILRGHRQVTGK